MTNHNLLTNKSMKINSATTQVNSELADILLSVDFSIEDQKKFKLKHSSVIVSYNLEGALLSADILEMGESTNCELTEEELKQALSYIEDNELKTKLIADIKNYHNESLLEEYVKKHNDNTCNCDEEDLALCLGGLYINGNLDKEEIFKEWE